MRYLRIPRGLFRESDPALHGVYTREKVRQVKRPDIFPLVHCAKTRCKFMPSRILLRLASLLRTANLSYRSGSVFSRRAQQLQANDYARQTNKLRTMRSEHVRYNSENARDIDG